MHEIRVYADSQEAIKAAAKDAGAKHYQCFPFRDGFVGIIGLEVLSQRQYLRNDSRVSLFPHHSSPADVSHHAKNLGIHEAKTARDLHAAVFAELDLDHFDPDLLS